VSAKAVTPLPANKPLHVRRRSSSVSSESWGSVQRGFFLFFVRSNSPRRFGRGLLCTIGDACWRRGRGWINGQ